MTLLYPTATHSGVEEMKAWVSLVAPFCVHIHSIISLIYVAYIFLCKYKYMGMYTNNYWFYAF